MKVRIHERFRKSLNKDRRDKMSRLLKSIVVLSVIINLLFLNTSFLSAKVLNFIEAIQEMNQWCWAGVCRAVLYYYGKNVQQCSIAEFTRKKADWHDFGSVDCCVDPNQGCNYWNYLYGSSGCIRDILKNWNVQNYGSPRRMYKYEVEATINDNRPFIVRWGWKTGGGHFVAGHGIEGNTLYYMDPWYGEGFSTASYDWVVLGGNHEWTHSVVATSVQPMFSLTIAAGTGGTTDPKPGTYTYQQGAKVTVTAIPDTYYQFYNWSGSVSGSTNPIVVTVNSNRSIKANFSLIQAPQNFQGQKVLNRSLSQAEYINVLNWQAHPSNVNIANYQIYIWQDQDWVLLTEVNTSTFKHWHRNVDAEKAYAYAIIAVTNDGRMGIPAYIIVS